MNRFVLASFFLLSIVTACFARDISIHIIDTDLDLPLEGAILQTADGRSFTADADGFVHITLADGSTMIVQANYPGYQSLKLVIGASSDHLEAKMVLQGVMGSTELVIEARKPGQSDAKPGVSTSVDREEMHSTANIGLIEDVMSTIKTLPGVGYTGGFNALPSIRGGEPQELTAVLDGFIVENPFHWGGAYSIFNPDMVQSAKLSNGVFSAAYGYATSGLLEVVSREPDYKSFQSSLGLTTSSGDILLSIPFDGKGGLMIGGKATWWDPLVALIGLINPSLTQTLYQAPFIRDVYLKGSWNLSPELIWYLNGFFGSDGVGIKIDGLPGQGSLTVNDHFNWINYLGFGSTGIKWNPNNQVFLHFMAGAGWASSVSDFTMKASGSQDYSSAFVTAFNSMYSAPPLPTSFSVTQDLVSHNANSNYNIQSRLDLDVHPLSWMVLSLGANEMIQFWTRDQTTTGTLPDTLHPDANGIVPLVESTSHSFYDQNKAFNSAVYSSLNLKTADESIALDIGIRLDHLYIMGKDGFALQTYPVLNPRANLSFTAVKNYEGVESLTFTLGSGLFSRPPVEMAYFDTNYNLNNYEVKPNQVWTSVVGTELKLDGGYKIQLEGYFKQVFNRFYYNYVNTGTESGIKPHFDGQAIIWGIDLMLQKYQSRYIDGWLTASYTNARYRNPVLDTGSIDPQTLGPSSATTDWYWPSFHRFFNANLIVNFKPVTGFTITTHLAFATGKPQPQLGAVTPYALSQNGEIIEQWQRSTTYSDTERTQFSIPLDIRLAWNWYEPRSKVSTEFYIAAEDVFTNLYSPKGQKAINPYTGQEMSGSDSADFSIGFPMISIGFKWSY